MSPPVVRCFYCIMFLLLGFSHFDLYYLYSNTITPPHAFCIYLDLNYNTPFYFCQRFHYKKIIFFILY